MTSGQLFSRLLKYSLRYWKGFAVAVLAMLVTAATETAFPALMKPLLDKGFRPDTEFNVWLVPIGVLLIFIVRGLSSFVMGYTMQWVSNSVLRDLRQAMFSRLISMPVASFDSASSGSLIAKVISESQFVMFAATNVVTIVVRDSLVLIGLLGWLFYLNWKLTLIVVLLIPPLAFLTFAFSKRMRSISESHMVATSDMTATVEEAISGNRVVKVFGGQHYEQARFDRVNAEYRGQAMRLAVAQALQSPINQFIAATGVATILTIWIFQTRAGNATVGDFVSFITAMLMMFSPLRHLSDINAQLQRGLTAAQSVFSLIDERSERDLSETELPKVRGEISFRNVRFQYATRDKPALDGITLEIPSGSTYALVGPSGGGKSSLINLLPRLYDHQSGEILIDGVDITSVSLRSLRSKIAVVSQDVVLFNDTIANNISYGRSDVTKEQVWQAACAANLESFIQSLPNGLETVVGDRGVRISGGQRQRIAIARAILKDAPILILDEATSALDTTAEASIKEAIDRLRKNRTTLIVAHRLSTIQNADQIVVLDQGKIIQQGSHAELISKKGLYLELYSRLQQDSKSQNQENHET